MQRVLTTLILFSYILLAVFGLFSVGGHLHAAQPVRGCPFMEGTHSVCPMNFFEHLTAWQSATRAVKETAGPVLALALFAVAFVFGTVYILKNQFPYARWRFRHPLLLPATLLFSQGILHPKAP